MTGDIKRKTISQVNEIYFGKDRRKNYLKHDFSNVLHGIIQRDIILQVELECSKGRHFKKEGVDDKGNRYTAEGDYDPDNAGFLYDIFGEYEKGMMVDVRLLLHPFEKGTGGSFIRDIALLTTDDFIKYYKYSDKKGTRIPNLLFKAFMIQREGTHKLSGSKFIEGRRDDIDKQVTILVEKARNLDAKNYYDKVIKNYQSLKLHKDKTPEKYDLEEELEQLGFLTSRKTVRKDKAKIDVSSIANFLNDFADIIAIYQNLVGDNTSFIGSNWPLDTYIRRTFELFRKEVSDDIKKQIELDIVKNLDASLRVVGWQHNHNE